MPRNIQTVIVPTDKSAFLDEQQGYWYKLASTYMVDKSVLDVGAGSGYGMKILMENGVRVVHGIDILPRSDFVQNDKLPHFKDKTYDFCTCIDVIEHTEDDVGLLKEMQRIARTGIFLTTPNWHMHRCCNPYHVREYTPDELLVLLDGLRYEIWSGSDRPNVFPPKKVGSLSEVHANFGVFVQND